MSRPQREKASAARMVREQLAAEKRRKRVIWTTVIALFGVALAGMIGWMFFLSHAAERGAHPRERQRGGQRDRHRVRTGRRRGLHRLHLPALQDFSR